jgi:glycosyltransferase involved in cell wall biosynthesis
LLARAWALANVIATLRPGDGMDERPERERYRDRQRAARLHLRKLAQGTRLGRAASEPPREGTKRLLAVVPGAQLSGAERVLLHDLIAARVAGWTVRCACSEGPLVEELVDAGIAHLPIPDLRLPTGSRPVAFARSLARSLLVARRLRRDTSRDEIVVANGVNVLPALRFARLAGRVVFFAHDVLVRPDRLQLARLGVGAVDVAVAVSDAVAVPLAAMGMATTVVHNGTAWPVEPADDWPPQPPVVGCTAVLTEWKGLHVLLEAMTKLERSDALLELVGIAHPKDGAYEETLRRRAEQPDLAGRVRFVGSVADPLVPLRRWSVAVSASVDPEAGPLTALEAMSVGVPFVATDHGGVAEVLGDAGLLVPPGDASALAAAIDRLLSDTALRARCRAAGPKGIVDRHLTLDDQRATMLSIFEELASASA